MTVNYHSIGFITLAPGACIIKLLMALAKLIA
jgi:hypothetical protein